MLRNLLFFALLMALGLFTSCGEKRSFFYKGPEFISFTSIYRGSTKLADLDSVYDITENDNPTTRYSVGVGLSGAQKDEDVVVNFTFESIGAITEGPSGNYRMITRNSVTIPAGTSEAKINIDFIGDNVVDLGSDGKPKPRAVKLTLTGSEPAFVMGYPGSKRDYLKTIYINYLEDDNQ